MPVQLSELLERIRPTGAPGAPSEGERERLESGRIEEMAAIAVVLSAFEQEAGTLIAAANDQATRLHNDAEQREHEIHSGLPDQMAAAETAETEVTNTQTTHDQQAVRAASAEAIAVIQGRSNALISSLEKATMEAIWSIVPVEAQAVEARSEEPS